MNAQDIVNPVRGARVSYCGMHALGPPQIHDQCTSSTLQKQWANNLCTHNRNCRSGVEGTCTHGLRPRYDSSGTVTPVCHKVLCIGLVVCHKVTGAVKFRLQEGSGKCPAGSPNLSLDQDWISSRPQYGCDPHF